MTKNRHIQKCHLDNNADEEAYELFKNYLNSRHNDGQMATMSFSEFHSMIHNSPIDTFMIKYRDENDELIACMLVDSQRDGLSAVYSFFNPNQEKQSIGTFLILDSILLTKELSKKWLYLGYLVKNSPKMAYKARVKPYQLYENGKWMDAE